MIKLVCFFRRNPKLTREEFHEHWLTRHGPLIAQTPELARHLVRYEQNHRLESDYERDDPSDPGFDGATVQWMESMRSFHAFVREPSYAEKIAPDEGYLLDRSSIALLFTHDADAQIDARDMRESATVKLCALLRRKPGTSAEAFAGHWSGPHADLVRGREDVARHLLAYHQSRRLERDYERDAGGGWDGLAEQWFLNADEFRALRAEPRYADIRKDAQAFMDETATRYILSAPPDLIVG